MRIAIISGKGGCGKSTTAIHLSRAIADTGQSVSLVDQDLQQGAIAPFSKALKGVSIARFETELANSEGVTVIDCSNQMNPTTIGVLNACNVALLPCPLVHKSIDEAEKIEAIIKQLSMKHIMVRYLITFYRNYQAETKEKFLRRHRGKVCETIIPFALGVEVAMNNRQTIFDTSPNTVAARRYKKLAQELLALEDRRLQDKH